MDKEKLYAISTDYSVLVQKVLDENFYNLLFNKHYDLETNLKVVFFLDNTFIVETDIGNHIGYISTRTGGWTVLNNNVGLFPSQESAIKHVLLNGIENAIIVYKVV